MDIERTLRARGALLLAFSLLLAPGVSWSSAPENVPAAAPTAAEPKEAPAAAATAPEKAAQPAAAEPKEAPAAAATAPDKAAQPAAAPTAAEPKEAPVAAEPAEKPEPRKAEPATRRTEKQAALDKEWPNLKTDGSSLARQVKEAIAGDESLVAPKSLKLHIAAKGHMVSLSGSAGTIYDREQAARRAEGTDGVAGIHPGIDIRPPSKLDPAALEAAVAQAVKDANVAGDVFAAKASADGTVHLNGSVTNEWMAVNAVKRVPGVTAIAGYKARQPGRMPPKAETELAVVAPSSAQDQVLDGQAKEALKAAGISGVTTEVKQGIVHLSGRVSDLRSLIAASRTVLLVPGVLGVSNDKLSAPGRVYRVGETRESGLVERDVRSRIRQAVVEKGEHYRIERLGVHVIDGSVIVSGRASSEDAAYAAVEAAMGVAGVQEVVNALTYPALAQGS